MNTVELFCGTKSFSKVSHSLGHKTLTFDMERLLNPDVVADILVMRNEEVPLKTDILWASPPCEGFSVAAIGKNWNKDHTPKHPRAEKAQQLVLKTIDIINTRKPKYWFIENPRGKLRKMPFMKDFIMHTVTYCQYGDTRMKPTDIWTNAKWWEPKPRCKMGDSCHVSAPRGSQTGTQGIKGARDRSRIPSELFVELFKQCDL